MQRNLLVAEIFSDLKDFLKLFLLYLFSFFDVPESISGKGFWAWKIFGLLDWYRQCQDQRHYQGQRCHQTLMPWWAPESGEQTLTCASIWCVGVVDKLAIVQDVVEHPAVVVAVLYKVSPKKTKVKPKQCFWTTCLHMRWSFPCEPMSPPLLWSKSRSRLF